MDTDSAFDKGVIFEFQSGGDFMLDSPNDTEDGQGLWEIRDTNKLTFTDQSSSLEFTIVSLTNSELRLLLEDEEMIDFGSSSPEGVIIGLTFIFTKQ